MGIKKTRIENKVRGEKKWKRNKGEGEFREKRNRTAKEGGRRKAQSLFTAGTTGGLHDMPM